MKLVNSRGRVLLEVYSATTTPKGVMYSYRGEGCGGCVFLPALQQTIEAIRSDSPSAKVVGTLPSPPLDE